MAIKKHVSWDGHRFRGFVDIVQEMPADDSSSVAKDVLMLMVVSLKN